MNTTQPKKTKKQVAIEKSIDAWDKWLSKFQHSDSGTRTLSCVRESLRQAVRKSRRTKWTSKQIIDLIDSITP